MLLDTHVLLWWQSGSGLSARAERAIRSGGVMLVSTTTCWEVGMLLTKGRITLDRDPYDWLRDLQASELVEYVDPSPEASMQAGLLPSRGFLGDPADAVLYCQAREHGWTLISKDSRIRDFAKETREVKTLW